MKFQTKAIHAGISPDPSTGAIVIPIYQNTILASEDKENLIADLKGRLEQ